jgi:hypothetical protein
MSGGRIALIIGLLVVAAALVALLVAMRSRKRQGSSPRRTASAAPVVAASAQPPAPMLARQVSPSVGEITVGVMFGQPIVTTTCERRKRSRNASNSERNGP